jgi:hypothetical protein
MSMKLTAAIAAGALVVGLLLGAAGAVVAGDGTFSGMMGNGAGQCDVSHMASHMTTEQMTRMMGGSFDDMMGTGMGAGMGSGLHSQHHGARP